MKSIIIIDRRTGKPVAESFSERLRREGAHHAHFEVLSAGAWLGRYNGLVRAAGGAEPSSDAFVSACVMSS